MRAKHPRAASRRAWAVTTLVFAVATSAWAGSKYKVLYSFQGGNDGAAPYAAVALDGEGNLYGTTGGGGAYNRGTVFKLVRQSGGGWAESVLHNFNGSDGSSPNGEVIFDSAVNLYGTTTLGGAHLAGTAFELSPTPHGWTSTTLYDFCAQPNCADGDAPWFARLLIGKTGDLYGTSQSGGPFYGGVVFELTPNNGTWIESVLHSFDGENQTNDGSTPYAGLVSDASGNLYGTTALGGKFDAGTIFELKLLPDDTWKEHRLHNFGSFPHDGRGPGTELVFDSFGNLYGTTASGGRNICVNGNGCGTIFELSRTPDGRWKETVLYHFAPGRNGNFANSRLVFDASGNLYGTAIRGGNESCGCGVVYKLAPNPDGTWTYSVLHRFQGPDGALPKGVIVDSKGRLFGTTQLGGAFDLGVVFRLTLSTP